MSQCRALSDSWHNSVTFSDRLLSAANQSCSQRLHVTSRGKAYSHVLSLSRSLFMSFPPLTLSLSNSHLRMTGMSSESLTLWICATYVSTSSNDFKLSMAKTHRNPSPVLMYWSLIALRWQERKREKEREREVCALNPHKKYLATKHIESKYCHQSKRHKELVLNLGISSPRQEEAS